MDTSTRLTTLERWLVVILIAAAVVFGLLPLLAPVQFATLSGYPGNDPFIYRLAGAATFGYAVGLTLGLRQGTWAAVKLAVIAVLTFNLASIYTCGAEIIHPNTAGGTRPRRILDLCTSIAFVAITAFMLYRHRQDAKMAPDTASWIVPFIVLLKSSCRPFLVSCHCSIRNSTISSASKLQTSFSMARQEPQHWDMP